MALDLFAARGYHATSITHIIEKASVARGTFYQYFRSTASSWSGWPDDPTPRGFHGVALSAPAR